MAINNKKKNFKEGFVVFTTTGSPIYNAGGGYLHETEDEALETASNQVRNYASGILIFKAVKMVKAKELPIAIEVIK